MYSDKNIKDRQLRSLALAAVIGFIIGLLYLIDWLFGLGWF